MATDIIAQDLAAQALAAAPRKPVQLVILGQSNERGNVAAADAATYPAAFRSARNPSLSVPIGPAVTRLGGPWPAVHDALWDWGYGLHIVNAAWGGLSFRRQGANSVAARQNNFAYFKGRAASGFGRDRGDFGDIVSFGGKTFRCKVGNTRAPLSADPGLPAFMPQETDGAVFFGNALSGGSAPDVSATVVGADVVDGGITWTCIDGSAYTNGSSDYADVMNNGKNAYNAVLMPTSSMAVRGYDPLAFLQRALEAANQDKTAFARRIVYIANGQSDMGESAGGYASVLCSIATFWLQNGFDVMIGLTHFSPASGTTTQYGNLSSGVATALATLQAYWGTGRVLEGANLYALMGSTGPMASGGAFLQSDNIHINGAGAVGPDVSGVSCAAKHVADRLKTALPRIIR